MQNGNQKRQPEAATRNGNRSGKKKREREARSREREWGAGTHWTARGINRTVNSLVTTIFSAFKRLETAARPTPSRRAASGGLFPSRINCKSVSSLVFFFAMETSWKHHGNFWFTAVVSVWKGPFSALAVSIFGLPCAAYIGTPPRNPSISLPVRKMPPFRVGNCKCRIRGFRMDTS